MYESKAIERIEELVRRTIDPIDVSHNDSEGRVFTATQMHEIKSRKESCLATVDLQSLMDLKDILDFSQIFAHIRSETEVALVKKDLENDKSRVVLAVADYNNHFGTRFNFGRWHDSEEFIIELMTKFKPNADLDKCLEIAGSLKYEESVHTEDDGYSQKYTKRSGTHIADGKKPIEKVLRLIPNRYFSECEQVESPFILRVREGRTIALFEADSSAWKINAFATLKQWLKDNLPEGTPVV